MAPYDVVEGLADGYDHTIPGHDPMVALWFPRAAHIREWICLQEQPFARLAALALGEVVVG